MARNAISIRQMGIDACWTLIQQALGMPDIKMNSDFFSDKVALLLFARPSLPERLCCTAAVRQMSGTTIYEGAANDEWRSRDSHFQNHLLPIFSYYLDCLYVYGIPLTPEEVEKADLRFPVINAGNWDKHPAHALADLACLLHVVKNLDGIETAWIGCDNGTLYSMLELMEWFPFKLHISMPPDVDKERVFQRAKELKKYVEFYDSPEKAVENVRFIYAGKREKDALPDSKWQINKNLMDHAPKNAKLLLSASPIRAIPIEKYFLTNHVSLLTKQAEYRLAIHKRILHWVFG